MAHDRTRPNRRALVRTWAVVWVAAATLFGGGVMAAGTAQASTQTDYVALGDSYSAGVGTRTYDLDSTCQRSSKSYPALWASRYGTRSFSFTACTGATTQTVQSGQLGPLNSGTDLVTITAGGNDAGFADVVTACRTSSDADCFGKLDNAESIIRNTLPGRLDSLYGAIRSRAPYARVVVLSYPQLYETGSCFGGIALNRRQRIDDVGLIMNSTLRDRAQAAGFTFADVDGRFAGHRLCSGTQWLNGPSIPLSDSYHPNVDGHASGYLPTLSALVQ
ncbi:SGNH/GDSL hydrolase family protein [Streptomyces sp. NPDC001380]|uniref:SGNH/GDSL hydrolase family protein n=1 Tax=Streptomyces sp. NPDC001380 TaxID=3364566 RepID=UPI0036820D38